MILQISFHDAVEYMQSLKRFGIKLGNQRMEALLGMLGNPHRMYKCVHVAGTNGKGSTCAMTASILQASGYKTGVYLSPYVFDLRERVQINGEMISEDAFADIVGRIKPMIEQIAATSLGQVTEFELKTALAFTWFAEQKVDAAVIEVGMGGLLDCTNVITPEVCAITSIGLDHMERLGSTLGEIAYQKAGIIKKGVPVVSAVTESEPRMVIEKRTVECESDYHIIASAGSNCGSSVTYHYEMLDGIPYVSISGIGDLSATYKIGLFGKYQAINACTAATICSVLASNSFSNISQLSIAEGLLKAWLPGRMQVVGKNPWIVLDGAHNPQALGNLLDSVAEVVPHRKRIVVFGMTQPHKPTPMAELIRRFADVVILTTPKDRRGMNLTRLAEPFRQFNGKIMTSRDANTSLELAKKLAGSEDLVLLTGSFYLVGDVSICS